MKKENLKIAKFRNCAERQASLSALENDGLHNNDLKILILFRLDNKVKKLTAEKLLPCMDCYEKFVIDLERNKGTMLLVSEEKEAQGFLKNNSKPIKELDFGNHRFLFFKGEELSNLKLESELGSNIS